MKICMVFYDMQEFGGLEEYAVTLAVSLRQCGHKVSVLSAMWIPSNNQYLRRLNEQDIPIVQLPKFISYPASHWPTKENILKGVMWLFMPLVYLLGAGLYLLKRRNWTQSLNSANSWLRGQLMNYVIAPDRRKTLARYLLNWWRLRWTPDLLHIHGYTTNLLFAIDWAYDKKVPVVYEEHQTPDSQFDWWEGFQTSVNKATVVVAVSDKSAQALREVCGVTKPVVVRSPLLPDPAASGWRKNGRQDNEPLCITTVARLGVAKGLSYLLEAIVQVESHCPSTQFKVYGDGELREELLAYAAQLGLDGNAIFVGSFTDREELSRIMAQTDIFVMSSVLEGQPLAVVEAMAYGCPIVTTAVGGIPELIKDGVNGLLCEPRNPACLAQKINSLIEDPDLRQRLGYAARKSYEFGPYQPTSVSNYFISVYEEVLREEDLQLAS